MVDAGWGGDLHRLEHVTQQIQLQKLLHVFHFISVFLQFLTCDGDNACALSFLRINSCRIFFFVNPWKTSLAILNEEDGYGLQREMLPE
jgi:hypothetical protein